MDCFTRISAILEKEVSPYVLIINLGFWRILFFWFFHLQFQIWYQLKTYAKSLSYINFFFIEHIIFDLLTFHAKLYFSLGFLLIFDAYCPFFWNFLFFFFLLCFLLFFCFFILFLFLFQLFSFSFSQEHHQNHFSINKHKIVLRHILHLKFLLSHLLKIFYQSFTLMNWIMMW